jgi:hypothetical protein
MTDADKEIIAKNPFTSSGMATTIESFVGEAMIEAERKAGHKNRQPLSPKNKLALTAKNPLSQLENATELAAYLVDNPCLGRVELAKVFKCSKETAGLRASIGCDIGLIIKIRTKSKKSGQGMLVYVAANNHALLPIINQKGTTT